MTTPFYLRSLQEAPARLDEVIARVDAEAQRIRVDPKLSAQGRYEATVALREATKAEVAEILERAREAQASAERHISVALRPPTDTSERLLRESEEQRAWRRTRTLLESGTDVSEVITRAGEAGDVATLRALRTELPTWLETTATEGVDDLRRPGARQRARQQVEPFLEAIEQAEAPHLPTAQREALETKFRAQALGDAVRA